MAICEWRRLLRRCFGLCRLRQRPSTGSQPLAIGHSCPEYCSRSSEIRQACCLAGFCYRRLLPGVRIARIRSTWQHAPGLWTIPLGTRRVSAPAAALSQNLAAGEFNLAILPDRFSPFRHANLNSAPQVAFATHEVLRPSRLAGIADRSGRGWLADRNIAVYGAVYSAVTGALTITSQSHWNRDVTPIE